MDLEKEKDDVHLVRCCGGGGDSINGIPSDPTVNSAKMQVTKVYKKRENVKIFYAGRLFEFKVIVWCIPRNCHGHPSIIRPWSIGHLPCSICCSDIWDDSFRSRADTKGDGSYRAWKCLLTNSEQCLLSSKLSYQRMAFLWSVHTTVRQIRYHAVASQISAKVVLLDRTTIPSPG